MRGDQEGAGEDPGTAYDDPILGKDPQPDTMSGYVETTADNGGVHINSGIPNHAFYLAATALGGYAWDVAGKVWYWTLKEKVSQRTGFQEFAESTVVTATERYPGNDAYRAAIAAAWKAVGMGVRASLLRVAA